MFHKQQKLGYTLTTMALRRPLISILKGLSPVQSGRAATTFGEHRSQLLDNRLSRAITERRMWKAVENAADSPIDSVAKIKGEMTVRKIDRLTNEVKSEK